MQRRRTEIIKKITEFIAKHRTPVNVLVIACGIILFCTVYALILPAAAVSGNGYDLSKDGIVLNEDTADIPALIAEAEGDKEETGLPEESSTGEEDGGETVSGNEDGTAAALFSDAVSSDEDDQKEDQDSADSEEEERPGDETVSGNAEEGKGPEQSVSANTETEASAGENTDNTNGLEDTAVSSIKEEIPEGASGVVVGDIVPEAEAGTPSEVVTTIQVALDERPQTPAPDSSLSGNEGTEKPAEGSGISENSKDSETAEEPAVEESGSDNSLVSEPGETDAEETEIAEPAPIAYAHFLSADLEGIHLEAEAEDSAMLPETTKMLVDEVSADSYDLRSLGELVYGRAFTIRFTAETEDEDGSFIVRDVFPADNIRMTISTDAPDTGKLDTKVALDLDRNGAYVLQESTDGTFIFTAGQISTVGLFVVSGEPEVEELPVFAHKLTTEVSGMTIEVEAEDAAMIPEKARLVVEEMASDPFDDILSSITNVKASHFLKCSIRNETVTEDGTAVTETILPASTVTVKVTVPDAVKDVYRKIVLNPADGREYALAESDADVFQFETDVLDTVGLIVKSELAEKLTASVDGGEVVLEAGEDARIPEDAVLTAEEIPIGSAEYSAFRNDAESKGRIGFARFFRLRLTDKEDADVIPAAPVTVTFDLGQNRNADAGFRAVLDMDHQAKRLSEREAEAFSFQTAEFGTVGTVAYDYLKLLYEVENDYSVTMYYNRSSGVPDGAALAVRELDPESDEYKEYRAMLEEALGSETAVKSERLFDITLLKDGQEIEPSGYVDVEIRLADKATVEGDEIKVVHFEEEKAAVDTAGAVSAENQEEIIKTPVEIEKVETAEEDGNSVEVRFEADQFSIYGIVGTEEISTSFTAGDGSTYEVTVTYDKNMGLPENAKLAVSEVTEYDAKYEDYVNQAADAIRSRARDLDYIKLLDIQIVDENGNKAALDHAVSVRIKLLDREQAGETTQIVHFEGTTETPVLMESSVEEDTVAFSTEGFSVYAVVDVGVGGNEARVKVNFYGKDTENPLETVYVKNSDTLEELEEIVTDPGCGELDSTKKELFDGWIISTVNTTDGSTYTIETEGKTIEDVRQYLEQLDIKEGDIVNVYAKIVRTITISYEGESENTLIGTVVLKVLGSDNPASADNNAEYTISMAYTPATSTQAFMGWNVAEGASNIISATLNDEPAEAPYQNGTKITVKGDVKLSVNAPFGHWLVFDENGHGATYNAPQFVKDGETTKEPALEMVRLGYSFGGWYKLKDTVDIASVPKDTDGYYIVSDTYFDEFAFNEELEDNVTAYARWISAETAPYTVIVWKERMTDTYAENGGTGEGKEKNYDFAESYTFTGTVGENASAVGYGTTYVVDGDDAGTPYYNARIRGTDVSGGSIDTTAAYTGYHCAGYDTDVTIRPEGNSVLNVYYDRNTVTYTFYTYGQSASGGTWYLCKEDGTRMYKEGDHSNRDNPITLRNEDGSYDSDGYNGYVRHDDGNNYYYSESGACSGEQMREAHWEYVPNTGSQWNVYQKSTGLYGEPLNWPEDTSIWWYENYDDMTGTGTGTRMTYKDAFLPLDDDMTVEYWGTNAAASGTIHFWTQDVNGTTYTDQVQVNTGNANFNINDKFTGFYAVQYRTDNGQWQNVGAYNEETGIYGSAVSYRNRLDIRYNRIKAAITFLDGAFYDGNGNPIENETPQAEPFRTTEEYFYGADVSSYNKGMADYYTPPEKPGYTFAGWYADDACTVEYDFNTMPATGITVYAKWIQNQYRVFLHPNVPETDTSLNWGSNTQGMNFRVSSGSKVSAPTGTRTGYKFIGWYLDEACTKVFDSSRFVLNDTTVTTPYDKSVDMTDVMNKYGNIEGTGSNSDATGYNGGDRFWITKKLDLYAKWRAELIGAEGIGVKYDANGGSGAPSDTTLYLDNTDTIAQGAPTPPDETQQFLHWVMQRYDETQQKFVDLEGDEYIVYPGGAFTVLKSNALVEELEGSTEDDPKYRYTVQLRAEYGPKETPTPTHLTWYANGGISADGTTDRYTDPELQINEAVSIRPEDTFKRDGYAFLGWARVDSTVEGYEIAPKNLTEEDLFLKFEDGKFYAEDSEGRWTEVNEVAADERMPYHDLYAVWELKKYTVTVVKNVNGLDGDEEIPFTFTPSFTGLPGSDYTSVFQLVGREGGADIGSGDETKHYEHIKEFVNVPYGTVFTINEQGADDFSVKLSYAVTGADKEEENIRVSNAENGSEITANGDVVLTVSNTRKIKIIRIQKTDADGKTPLGDAVFTVNVGGTEFTLTSDKTDGFLKNDIFRDGNLMVPYGSYELTEETPPAGYNSLPGPVPILVNDSGVSANGYEVIEPTEGENYYTIIVPNNPGVSLPSTGGSGTGIYRVAGVLMIFLAACMLMLKKEI